MAEFNRVYRVQGMDSNAIPRFQMTPKGGVRYVALHGGAGATVTSLNTAVCTITEVRESALPADDRAPGHVGDRYFKLHGLAHGVTLLMAIGGSILIPLFLEVGVKEKRKQLIMFNFVHDNAHHATHRSSSDVGHWMPTLNYIWRRQANVELVNHGVHRRDIAQNLGDPIMLPQGSLGATGNTIGAAGDAGVDLNVFFVWDLQETGNTADVDAVTTIGTAGSGNPGTCIFEDHAGAGQPISLAHEIGHHLGLTHLGHRKIDLMWPTTGERGFNLSKADVNTANP
jgi:hypothetical protein